MDWTVHGYTREWVVSFSLRSICLIDAFLKDWEKLDENEANLWIAATNKHLYKSTKNGGRNEIYQLPRGGRPNGDVLIRSLLRLRFIYQSIGWDKIDDSTDILQLVTTNRNVYKHHKNGQIYVYSGVDERT